MLDVLRVVGHVVLPKELAHDARVGATGKFDPLGSVRDSKSGGEGVSKGFPPRAAGVQQGAVDVEENEFDHPPAKLATARGDGKGEVLEGLLLVLLNLRHQEMDEMLEPFLEGEGGQNGLPGHRTGKHSAGNEIGNLIGARKLVEIV